MLNTTFDWKEIDSLIRLLHAYGIRYLMGNGSSEDQEEEHVEPVHLIQRLAGCGYPLVENASIALFLLHPELALSVREALDQSSEEIAETIAVLTLAILYLQQWWLFRLTFALGHLPSFPEAPFVSLWQDRHLPEPASGYGLEGLLALQAYQEQRYGVPLNFLDDWDNQIQHLLMQEEAAGREISDEVMETLRRLSIT